MPKICKDCLKRLTLPLDDQEGVTTSSSAYCYPVGGAWWTEQRTFSLAISRFENNIFYATLLYSQHDKPHEVDCPPTMALALAVRARAPIFAEERVLNKAAISVPV